MRELREPESGGHDADDGVVHAVDADRAPEHILRTVEAPRPEDVADERDRRRADPVVVAGELPSAGRLDAEEREEAGGYAGRSEPLRVFSSAHDHPHLDVGLEPRKRGRDRLPVTECRIRRPNPTPRAQLRRAPFVNIDQRAFVFKRQRLELHGVDKAEHRGVRADPERERPDDDQRR